MSLTSSILIRTKNEAEDISKTLKLIYKQSFQPIEIIVVDSGSTDGTVEVAKQCGNIKLIKILPEEFSFGRSLNIGFDAAEGNIVVSISAHAFPCDQHWLQNLVKHFEDSQVAGAYGRQLPHPEAWPPVRRDYLAYYGNQLKVQSCHSSYSDHCFSNANAAIRRECWEKRPFNEILTGTEDREWARAILEFGFKLIYDPEAAVYHSHNESLQKVFQRTYRETLAHKALYGGKTSLRKALQKWYRSTLADTSFILREKKDYLWILQVPVYRLFSAYGYLRPDLPPALWEPFTSQRWLISSLNQQKGVNGER